MSDGRWLSEAEDARRRALRRAPAAPAQSSIELRAPGASITTGLAERRVGQLMAGARAEVQPESALTVNAIARPEVLHGLVHFDVPPQPAGRPFVVRVASYYV